MEGAAPAGTQACPSCGAPLAAAPGFTPWCRACDWNVLPTVDPTHEGRVGRLYLRASRLLGARLQREIHASPSLRPRLSSGFIVATAFSIIVLAGLAAVLAFGAWAILGSGNVVGWVLGVIALLFVWACRPRLGEAPRDGVVSGAEVPALWGLIERVAASLECPMPDVLVLDGDWNASAGVVGWRRRRVLTLGIPLFAVLDGRARVALLGHELGHFVNGDPGRSGLIVVAFDTLINAADVLEPDELIPDDPAFGVAGLLALPFNVLLLGLSSVVSWIAWLLLLAVFREGQRAEYYADRLASIAAGRDCVVRMLDAIGNAKPYLRAVHGLAIADDHRNLVEVVRRYVAETPPDEYERLRRAEHLFGSRLDHTHPPTADRILLVSSTGAALGRVGIEPEEVATIDAELARMLPPIQEMVVGQARDALYM